MMHRALRLLLPMAILVGNVQCANVAEGVAYIQPTDTSTYPDLNGYVLFKQADPDSASGVNVPTIDVDVTYLTGVPAGCHGFHVHQYGDTQSPQLVGGHFVPYCKDPSEDPNAPSNVSSCSEDEVHGIPPSQNRNPGDMGNLCCYANKTCDMCELPWVNCAKTKTFGQMKMSMLGNYKVATGQNDYAGNSVRSVVGRSVAIHTLEDDGTPGTGSPGNSGPSFAYGVIGKRAPGSSLQGLGPPASSSTSDTNVAYTTTHPEPDSIVCHFKRDISGSINSGIEGKAIIEVDKYKLATGAPDYCQFRAEVTGLTTGEHSFHFHDWGDLRYAIQPISLIVGPLRNEILDNEDLAAVSGTVAELYTVCTLSSVTELIGRSLTIHDGDISTPTIAMAVCGISNPDTCFETTVNGKTVCKNMDGSVPTPTPTPISPAADSGGGGGGLSGGEIFGILVAILACFGFVGLAYLKYNDDLRSRFEPAPPTTPRPDPGMTASSVPYDRPNI